MAKYVGAHLFNLRSYPFMPDKKSPKFYRYAAKKPKYLFAKLNLKIIELCLCKITKETSYVATQSPT